MTSTSRRAILGAIASAPALAVSCAPQPAAAREPSETLASLIARCEAEYARLEAIQIASDAAHEAAHKGAEREIEALPHTTVTLGDGAGAIAFTTSEPGTVEVARKWLADLAQRESKFITPDMIASFQRLVAAAEARDAEAARIRDRWAVNKLLAETEADFDALADVYDPVIYFEARTIGDMAGKVAFLAKHDLIGEEWAQRPILDDVRRLAGEA